MANKLIFKRKTSSGGYWDWEKPPAPVNKEEWMRQQKLEKKKTRKKG